MPYEQKPNSGSFWLTPKKRTGQDGVEYEAYSGSCNIKGINYWINGYLKETKAGKVFDLKFKEKEIPIDQIPF